jgi:hypothetical protein
LTKVKGKYLAKDLINIFIFRGSNFQFYFHIGKYSFSQNDHGNPNTKNFNEYPFTGENGECAKYTWAESCHVIWDGINSGVKNPCDTSTTTTTA